MAVRLTRRAFTLAVGAVAAGTLIGCGHGGSAGIDRTKIWRLSARGKRASEAAKSHDANKRFATAAAAFRAHPGDTSEVVPIDTKLGTWLLFFGGGDQVIDLRHLSPSLRSLAG